VFEPRRATSPVAESDCSSESEVQNAPSEYSTAYSDDDDEDTDFILASPELPNSSVQDPTSEVELPWHGACRCAVGHSSAVVHHNAPIPQPLQGGEHEFASSSSTKLPDLPPELLASIFELLVGDPTESSSVNYRLSKPDTATPHFSHSWSLECVSRVNRQWRAISWPLLMRTLSIVHFADVATIARLPQRHMDLVQHLCITLDAIESLYVYICALLGLQTNRAQSFKDEASQKLAASGVINVGVVEEDGVRYVDGHFLTGFSLKRLTIFRPCSSNKTRGGESVTRGFTRFFNRSVVRLLADSASTLERVVFRDPNTKWLEPATLPVDTTLSALSMPKLSHLTYLSSHTIPPLGAIELPALSSLTSGMPHVDSGTLDTLLARDLTSLRTNHLLPHYPASLRVLHILPSKGIDRLGVVQLTHALQSLRRLRDLRICLAKPAFGAPEPEHIILSSIVELIESLSPTIRVLELQEPSGPTDSCSLIADAFISSVHRPEASAQQKSPHPSLVEPFLRLTQLEILSLVLQEERQGAPCQAKSNLCSRCGSPADSQWRHAGHMNCAEFLLNRLPSLQEVHFHCATDSTGPEGGTPGGEQFVTRYRTPGCVWGRPLRGREHDVVTGLGDREELVCVTPRWMDVGTRTRLWESAMI